MATPAQDPKQQLTERGKRLLERVLKDTELLEATERGYQDYLQGRYFRLEDVKRELGDV